MNISETIWKIFQSKPYHWAIPEKIQTRKGHGISRGSEERAYGNSRGQLKKKWNLQGCSRKTNV